MPANVQDDAPSGNDTSGGDGSVRVRGIGSHVAIVAVHLRQRLRPVCLEWDEADFEEMIQRIARYRVHWRHGSATD